MLNKITPKKNLGQNFLIDKNIIEKIISRIDFKDNLIFEIGPGTGALTFEILKKTKNFLALEIDRSLCKELWKKIDKKYVINGDIIYYDLGEKIKSKNFSIVSNLPYYISTKILFKIVNFPTLSGVYIMLQKELVTKITSSTGKSSRLNVVINTMFDVKEKFDISKTCFFPKPKVDSSFLIMKRKFEIKNEVDYLNFIKDCFSKKRKYLINSLKMENSQFYEKVLQWLDTKNMSKKIRSEDLSWENYIDLWKFINYSL